MIKKDRAEHSLIWQREYYPLPEGDARSFTRFHFRSLENILPRFFSTYAVIYGVTKGIIREKIFMVIFDGAVFSLPAAPLMPAEPLRVIKRKSPKRITPAPTAAPAIAKG